LGGLHSSYRFNFYLRGVLNPQTHLAPVEFNRDGIPQWSLMREAQFLIRQQSHRHETRNAGIPAVHFRDAEEAVFFYSIQSHS
jgi:hypothetical protein